MANYPTLRFPKYDGDWSSLKLGQIIETFSGGTPTSSNPNYYNGEIPFIRSAEINNDTTELSITKTGLESSSAKMVEKGDLLLALYGANSGETGISRIEGAINQAVLCIRSKEDTGFIKLFLDFKKERILSTYLQGGQGNLSATLVKDLNINIPSYEEQKKISSFFFLLDQKIEKHREKIEQLELFKKGMLMKIFSSEIRFKDETGREFPEWRKIALGHLGSFVKSFSYSRSNEGEGEYYHIHYGDIHSKYKGIVDSETQIPSLSIDVIGDSDTMLEDGDVIFADASEDTFDLGKSVVLLETNRRKIIGGLHTICFRPNKHLNPLFLHYFTQTNEYKKFISVNANGVSVYGLSKPALSSLEIPLPDLKEQLKISSLLFKVSKKIAYLNQKVSELERIKKGLLSQMLV